MDLLQSKSQASGGEDSMLLFLGRKRPVPRFLLNLRQTLALTVQAIPLVNDLDSADQID